MKTHCIHGHEFNEENTYITKKGHPQCRQCERDRQNAAYEKDPVKYRERQNARERRPDVKKYRAEYYQETKNTVWRRFSSCKANAKSHGKYFTLTREEYSIIISSNKCNYCGGNLPSSGGGLDRLDNKEGYILGNVTPCCRQCNSQKGNLEAIGFCYPRTVELMMELKSNANAIMVV